MGTERPAPRLRRRERPVDPGRMAHSAISRTPDCTQRIKAGPSQPRRLGSRGGAAATAGAAPGG